MSEYAFGAGEPWILFLRSCPPCFFKAGSLTDLGLDDWLWFLICGPSFSLSGRYLNQPRPDSEMDS